MVDLVNLVQTLTTPHPLDRYLELIRPMLTTRVMRAEIIHVRRSVLGSVTLTLRPTWQWTGHNPGQYVQIGVVIDGVRHTRCYSPVNAASRRDRHIQLTVKAHPEGLVSQYLYRNALPGMVVDLAPATGVFQLPEPRPDRILLVSGGSGITPVLSMLRTLAEEGYPGEVTFLHYAKSPEVQPHRPELAQIERTHKNFRVESRYTSYGSGYFDYDELERVAPWFADAQTFVCGPPGLMDAVRKIFEAEQLADRLHTEEFTLSVAPVEVGEAFGTVSFAASGVRAENDGAVLLEQAEAAGLTPEYGCRMGICFSCTSRKTEGTVRNIRTGVESSLPDEDIQICVSAPVGSCAVDL
jgi:ferredoxin-NADP reductase